MPDEPEVIRQQMEETRASLADKVATLEQQVVDTVSGTTSAVTETVANVKEVVQETVASVKGSVQESVESVRQAFDLSRQVDRHPWLFMAGSVALGYCAERIFESDTTEATEARGRALRLEALEGMRQAHNGRGHLSGNGAGERLQQEQRKPGFLEAVASQFSGELDRVKALAVGAGLGLVRDLVASNVPDPLKPRVTEVIDSFTQKLGGEVLQGPLLDTSTADRSAEKCSAL